MELYTITFFSKSYYFTSFGEDLNINEIYYKAIPITRNEIDLSLETNGLVFEAPIDIEPFNFFIANPTIKLASVVITSYPDMFKIFEGNIIKAEYNYEKRIVKITVGSKFILKNAEVPKRTYSRLCSFDFCDENCGLDINDFKLELDTIDFNYDDKFIISSSKIQNSSIFFDGGYIKTDKEEYQYISKREDDKIYLIHPLVFKPNKITIYGNCNKTLDQCKLFNNINNFGGFPYIPQKNLYSEGF